MALEKLTGDPPPALPATISSPAAGPSRALGGMEANVALERELESLKAKMRVMERRRIEDKKRIEELKQQTEKEGAGPAEDRFRGNTEKLIKGLQAKGLMQQQEIKELQQQLKEAEEQLRSLQETQAEHESAMELATIDREIAEATSEHLKAELEALRQKSEEAELELEILREENAEFADGMTAEERASKGWLQMERNNERLREALIRLRDLTQQQEEELRAQIKALEGDLQDMEPLRKRLAASEESLAQQTALVQDFRERLEVAELAEARIEEVQGQNIEQSEEIARHLSAIEDLEHLLELSEELEIHHVHNTRELQEEINFKDSVIVEQARRLAAQEQSLEDSETTMRKFRDLVANLQGDIENMRSSHAISATESEQLNSRSKAMMDLNMKLQMSAAKAQVKAIDLELRRMETEEAQQHLAIVQVFLPESYQVDRDSVLALLRFNRLVFKANMLSRFIRDRIDEQDHSGHEEDAFWGCETVEKLTWVSAMCTRFAKAMRHCSLEQFARYEGALYDLEPVERALNGWIDGLRRDDFKEKEAAVDLQRTLALISHLGEVHMSDDLETYADDMYMRVQLCQAYLDSAAMASATLKAMVQHAMPAADGDEGERNEYLGNKVDGLMAQTRGTKVTASKVAKELEELQSRSLSLAPEALEAFAVCESAARDLAELARQTGMDLCQLLHDEGRAEPVTYRDVQESIRQTAHSASGSGEGDVFATYQNRLRAVTSQLGDLVALSADLAQMQEFDRTPAPWLLRSQELKALRTAPADAEEEMRQLREDRNEARRTVTLRDESLSEAQLRIETLESRMRDAKAKAALIVDLEAQLARAQQQAATLTDDMAEQDRELKVLEADRDRWRKIAGDSRTMVQGEGGAGAGAGAGAKAGKERAVATAREMEALRLDIESLQAAVRHLREENRQARLTEQAGLEWLAAPLGTKPAATAQRAALVAAEAKDALGELLRLAAGASLYRLDALPEDKLAWKPARSTPSYHAAKQTEEFAAWSAWEDAVVQKSQLLTAQHHHRARLAEPRALRDPAAWLQIRLPGADGKWRQGSGRVVRIAGATDWEGLQGSPFSSS